MRILVDTNVLLDVLCGRKEFVGMSANVLKCCETKLAEGHISSLSVPNIVYILRKELDSNKTKEIIERIGLIFTVDDLKAENLKKAAALKYDDYEDALQSVCAERIKADYIVTRNIKDFSSSSISAISPIDSKLILDKYLYCLFNGKIIDLERVGSKAFGKSLNSAYLRDEVLIPIPPISVQQQVINECSKIDEEYNSTRMSIETYRQKNEALFAELDIANLRGTDLASLILINSMFLLANVFWIKILCLGKQFLFIVPMFMSRSEI